MADATTTETAPARAGHAAAEIETVQAGVPDDGETATMSKRRKKKQEEKRRKHKYTAETADRHLLYELSVQDPETEVDLIDQMWLEQRGRRCLSIREDFCGTAVVCGEWVKRSDDRTAIGVDLDPEVLGWGRERMLERIGEEAMRRVTLLEHDVLSVKTQQVDSVLAMNFSYWLLKTRDLLRNYFRSVHASLVDDGLFLLDCYGGSDAFSEMEEPRELDGFTYVWDQHHYNPITGLARNYIHFEFPDGTEMREAFEYTWRLWTLPEIREILEEAGFRKSVVYWEGTDEETEEGNGEWEVSESGEACPGWIAYIVAVK